MDDEEPMTDEERAFIEEATAEIEAWVKSELERQKQQKNDSEGVNY